MTLMQDPVYRVAAVTPSNTTDLGPVRAIYIGGPGNVAIRANGNTTPVTMVGLAVGLWHPVRLTHVFATGTTATDIVVGY